MRQIDDLTLFKILVHRETEDGFESGEISARVREILTSCQPVLGHVVRFFPEFTLHDAGHGERVVENIAKIIPEETLAKLSAIELSVLLYAGYLHDIGMASSEREFNAWLGSVESKEFIARSDYWSYLVEQSAETDEAETLRLVQDMAYTDYLRTSHASRGATFITNTFGDKSPAGIRVRNTPYAHIVAQVVASHWEDCEELRGPQYLRDEQVVESTVNVQYACIVLRLADLIDLDPERTPRVLAEFLDPRDPTSAEEWAKHRSMQGWKVDSRRIRFHARCTHPAIQRGLRQWMETIELERASCIGVVADNKAEFTDKYRLNLQEPVTPDRILSDGTYIYGDFRFELDYERDPAPVSRTVCFLDDHAASAAAVNSRS